ncbi:MAG: hypothetical protein ACREJM_08900 [Candidatus Saccharimonadales bacterium]
MTTVFIVLAIAVVSFVVSLVGFFMALSLTHVHHRPRAHRGSKS